MKLLLDQGLPRSAAALLRNAGQDAVHCAEIGLATAEDSVILEEGRRTGRVVITLDADFHLLMALSGAISPSVIRIRIQGLQAKKFASLVEDVINKCSSDLHNGALISVQQDRVRVRRLPLI